MMSCIGLKYVHGEPTEPIRLYEPKFRAHTKGHCVLAFAAVLPLSDTIQPTHPEDIICKEEMSTLPAI